MECPVCKQAMVAGYLYSSFSIHWLFDDDPSAKRMLGIGQPLQGKHVFKPTGERIEGWHCPACDHILIDKLALKPPSTLHGEKTKQAQQRLFC